MAKHFVPPPPAAAGGMDQELKDMLGLKDKLGKKQQEMLDEIAGDAILKIRQRLLGSQRTSDDGDSVASDVFGSGGSAFGDGAAC